MKEKNGSRRNISTDSYVCLRSTQYTAETVKTIWYLILATVLL
jgi:hypothetical protein